MLPRGLYRIKDGWGNQDGVRVKYDHDKELEIPASEYVGNSYEPSIDQLPFGSEEGK